MAITQTQTLPAPFLEDVTKGYAADIGKLTAAPLATAAFAPQVAPQDQYQAEAYGRVPGGIGAYEPYITGAGAAGMAPGAAQMGATAATTLGGIPSYISQAGALAPQTGDQYKSLVQDFMSPYQEQVMQKTLDEYDVQAGKGLAGIGQLAAMSGNLGGGREGVQRAEYQSASDRNRALLQAQMLQGGFSQAQQAAGQAYGQQMGLGQAQGMLGQQQLGIGQYQQGLGQLMP